MKVRCVLIGALVIAGFTGLTEARAQSADDIVKRVRKKYDQLKTLRIDFEQVYHWVMADETSKIRGTLYLTRDNKYRVELPNQLVVTDGKTVWTFSKDLNQVMIDRLSADAGNPLPGELLLKYSRDYRATILREETVDGTRTYVIELLPKKEGEFVKKARVWVDRERWVVVRLLQEDLNGNVTVYNVLKLVENPKLGDELFTFEIREGIQVVDMR